MKTVSWRAQRLVLGNDTDILLDLEDIMESRTSCFLNVVGLSEIKSAFSPHHQTMQKSLGVLENSMIGKLVRFTRGENLALVNVDSLITSMLSIAKENGRTSLHIQQEGKTFVSGEMEGKTINNLEEEELIEEQILTQGIDLVISYSDYEKAKRVYGKCSEKYHKPILWIQMSTGSIQSINKESCLVKRMKKSANQLADELQCAWKIVSNAPLLNQESR